MPEREDGSHFYREMTAEDIRFRKELIAEFNLKAKQEQEEKFKKRLASDPTIESRQLP